MKRKVYRDVFILYLIILMIGLVGFSAKQEQTGPIISPLAIGQAQAQTVYTPKTSQQQQIANYIVQVFGPDSSKAFELLTSPKCHENGELNPQALNDNTKWGGIGRDWGIFQINDHWQGVSNKAFLTDWRINIDMAHNIFVRSGDTFKMWTCGKELGI